MTHLCPLLLLRRRRCRYGEADGGGSCADDFGNALVNRWRATKQTYCAPTAEDSQGQGQGEAVRSEIDCYLVHQTRHHGGGDNLCVSRLALPSSPPSPPRPHPGLLREVACARLAQTRRSPNWPAPLGRSLSPPGA